jgi:fructose-1,6-bisphosphatase/inositol monophosphatase family enzyme
MARRLGDEIEQEQAQFSASEHAPTPAASPASASATTAKRTAFTKGAALTERPTEAPAHHCCQFGSAAVDSAAVAAARMAAMFESHFNSLSFRWL